MLQIKFEIWLWIWLPLQHLLCMYEWINDNLSLSFSTCKWKTEIAKARERMSASNFPVINSPTASGTHPRKSRIFAAGAGKFFSGVIDRSVSHSRHRPPEYGDPHAAAHSWIVCSFNFKKGKREKEKGSYRARETYKYFVYWLCSCRDVTPHVRLSATSNPQFDVLYWLSDRAATTGQSRSLVPRAIRGIVQLHNIKNIIDYESTTIQCNIKNITVHCWN